MLFLVSKKFYEKAARRVPVPGTAVTRRCTKSTETLSTDQVCQSLNRGGKLRGLIDCRLGIELGSLESTAHQLYREALGL